MKLHFFSKVTLLLLFIFIFRPEQLRADCILDNDLIQATPTATGAQARLVFTNRGKTDLSITALEFSCPCVVFHFKSTTAKPGQTGSVTITLDGWKEGLDDLEAMAVSSDTSKPHAFTIRLVKPEPPK